MAAWFRLARRSSTFSDYCKPAIRLAALMQAHSIFVFTHDSIGLGEDGPTHQPIEQLMMLRAVPDLTDFRPADANETAACWRLALERKAPCFFALSAAGSAGDRSHRSTDVYGGVSKGAYILEDAAESAGDSDRHGLGGVACVDAAEAAERRGHRAHGL